MKRLVKRVGLECLPEEHTLIIAGQALALDIDFDNHNAVKKVSLSFPESPEIVTRHTNKAEDILLRDLQFQAHESPLTKKLDRFAANLEILAALDKLSVIPGLNCHEAIAGIYESVEKLHLWEVERLKETPEMAEKDDSYVVKTAMCTRSGKPVMHTRDRLGLSLDYWQANRRLTTKKEEKTWSLLVGCAPSSNMVYTPLRVSEHWISADIKKAHATAEDILLGAENEPALDWLEPENTLLPATEPPKVDGMDGVEGVTSQKFPEVIFVAKFDPPLVVPYGLAEPIYRSTSFSIDPDSTTTFDELMLPRTPEDHINTDGRIVRRESTVQVYSKDGGKTTILQTNELAIEKIDYGCILTELPFSHPRQLVQMLPAFRQYAFLFTVLNKSFGTSSRPVSRPSQETEVYSKKAEFADFMSGIPIKGKKPLDMDVTFSMQSCPRLRVIFRLNRGTVGVTFEIRMNGVVEVLSQDVLKGGEEKGLTVKDLGRMLETTEDLGVWVEYVKRRLD